MQQRVGADRAHKLAFPRPIKRTMSKRTMSSSPRVRSAPGGFLRTLVVELPAAAARMTDPLGRQRSA